jgi:hypothetical protein
MPEGSPSGVAFSLTSEYWLRLTARPLADSCRCWSNYLGRLPQLPNSIVTVPKFEVFPVEDAEIWSAYTDSGSSQAHAQPSRTRAVSLLCLKLSIPCEPSNKV